MGNIESENNGASCVFFDDNTPPRSYSPHDVKSTQEIVDILKQKLRETKKELQAIQLSKDPEQNRRESVCIFLTEKERDIRILREQMMTDGLLSGSTPKATQQVVSRSSTEDSLVNSLQENNETLEYTVSCLSRKNRKLQISLGEEMAQKEQLLNRLSKLAGQRLTEDNPSITDLSDTNRPTKLAEVYSETYDNEWTDAFEKLTVGGYTDEEAICTLRLTLVNVVQFCKQKSTTLLQKTKEAVDILFKEFTAEGPLSCQRHLTICRQEFEKWGEIWREKEGADIRLQQRWKPKIKSEDYCYKRTNTLKVKMPEVVTSHLKKFRKDVAESMVPLVQQAYMTASWSGDCIPALKPYIKKCLFLGWIMAVQSPPLALAACQSGAKFDKDTYKEYTRTGQLVDFVVWPALLLHENGPLLGKGVAQGKKT